MWRLFYREEDDTFHAFDVVRPYQIGSDTGSPESDIDLQEAIEPIEELGYVLATAMAMARCSGLLKDEATREAYVKGKLKDVVFSLPIEVHGVPGNEFEGDAAWEYDEESGSYVLPGHAGRTGTEDLRDYMDKVELAVVERIDLRYDHLDTRLRKMEVQIGQFLDGLDRPPADVAGQAINPSEERPRKSYGPTNRLVAAFWEGVTEQQISEFHALVKSKNLKDRDKRILGEWFDSDDAAIILGKHRQTINDWCREGRIEAREKLGSGRTGREEWEIHMSAILYAINHDELPARPKAK